MYYCKYKHKGFNTDFRADQQHYPTDPVVAVLSGDFRAAFIYRLLKEFSVCQEGNVR